MKQRFIIFAIVLLFCGTLQSKTISPTQFMTWGIGDDQINIPVGSIITEAVLRINGVTSSSPDFNIHLLDDAQKGFYLGTDNSGLNYFDNYGAVLKGTFVNGYYICNLSQNDNPVSPIWSSFSYPCTITLADSSCVSLSSSVLSIIDYAGNGRGIGIGLDPGSKNFTFKSITLILTLKTYQGKSSTSKLYFSITPK